MAPDKDSVVISVGRLVELDATAGEPATEKRPWEELR
jgi:hypothetical protein